MKALAIIAVIAEICICGCSYGANGVDPRSIARNPTPAKSISVSAIIPPDFSVKQLRAVYTTNSRSVFFNGLNFPDGGPFPLTTKLLVNTTEAPGHLSAIIQKDLFAIGSWKAFTHW